MPTPLLTTVTDIQSTQVIANTSDGQAIAIPLTAILGKPQLNQPLFIIAATTGHESGSEHALAQALAEHLLES